MMPLSDGTNVNFDVDSAAKVRYADSITGANLKRMWDSDGHELLPNSFKNKRTLTVNTSTSSSSSPAPSSPFFGGTSRLAAYDALSSPGPSSKVSTSPSRADSASSMFPSSPSILPTTRADYFSQPVTNAVGASSSPSAIDANVGAEPLMLRLERGTVIQFGRKAKKPSTAQAETTLAIRLPSSVKNASRIHCTARIATSSLPKVEVEDKILLEVNVFGMNGMKIDGKLWRKGQTAHLAVVAGQRVQLAFWGWSATVIVAESEQKVAFQEIKKLPAGLKTPKAASRRTVTTLAGAVSSPFDSLFDGSDNGDLLSSPPPQPAAIEFLPSSSRAASPALSDESDFSLLSSPRAASLNELDDVDRKLAPQGSADDQDDSATIQPPKSQAAELAASLALDLPGLIASAVVFQPRATVGVEEVVKALLSEVGGMWQVLEGGRGDPENSDRENTAIDMWWEVVEGVLREEDFFGCIENVGLKDAAGNPLLPAYYYIPDKDPSMSRVEALEPFVKRVRGARTTGGGVRYFWRRPCLKKNR